MNQTVKNSVMLILFMAVTVCQASSTYRFEGPRNPQVVIDETATQYSLTIQLIPVLVFDPATNDKLTRAKCRGTALMALTRHLKPPSNSELRISGLQIDEFRQDGSGMVMQATLPKSGVRIVPRAEGCDESKAAGMAVPLKGESGISPLLTRAGDYRDSAQQLRSICLEQMEALSAPDSTDETVADVEQSILDKFVALERELEADTLLLTLERDEVRQQVKLVAKGLIEQLRQIVNMRQVSSMTAEEPFAGVLKADPILLQMGGARVIKNPQSGQSIIVSVASTAVKDNSASDRVRMHKVCRNKALAELLSQRKGLQVKYVLQAEDQTVVIYQDGQEEAASLETTLETTSAQVEGFIHSLPVVATWYSAAGDMYYLAIGKVVEQFKNKVGG